MHVFYVKGAHVFSFGFNNNEMSTHRLAGCVCSLPSIILFSDVVVSFREIVAAIIEV